MTSGSGLLTQFKVLGSLEAEMLLGLTLFAFQTQDDLTCGLRLLVKDWLGLSSKSHLLAVVSALSLGKVGGLAGFVLGHLVHFMLLALAGTVCSTLFRDVHHFLNANVQ